MINNYLFTCLCLFSFTLAKAQEETTVSVEKNQFKINMLLPGFVYEHGFSAKNTLYSELSTSIGYTSNTIYDESTFYFVPYLHEQFRHYYNLDKRAAKGKRTAFNSGNYIALSAIYNFQSISVNDKFSERVPSFTIAPVWGVQRTYKSKLNLGINLGAGVNFDKYDTELAVVANFTLGWVIGK